MIPRPSGLLPGLPATSIQENQHQCLRCRHFLSTTHCSITQPLNVAGSQALETPHSPLFIFFPILLLLTFLISSKALYIASSPEIWCHSSSPNTHQILMICWSCFLKIFHTRLFFFCTVTSLIQATLISIPCPPILSPAVKLSCLQCQSDIFPRGPKLLILKD